MLLYFTPAAKSIQRVALSRQQVHQKGSIQVNEEAVWRHHVTSSSLVNQLWQAIRMQTAFQRSGSLDAGLNRAL